MESRSTIWLCCLWYLNCRRLLANFHKIGCYIDSILYVYAKNHPVIRWVHFRGKMLMAPGEINCRRLGSTLWWTQKNDVTEITEQRVAIKFCVAGGTFSDSTIKTFREAEIIFLNIGNFYCVIFYEKTTDFLVG
mgnify:CR=1 FL=1